MEGRKLNYFIVKISSIYIKCFYWSNIITETIWLNKILTDIFPVNFKSACVQFSHKLRLHVPASTLAVCTT